MINTPLLLFPRFYQDKKILKQTGFGSPHYHKPDLNRQNDRLTPMFETMLQAYISLTADGFAPEKTLVFEVAGDIEEFQRAINKISGLEWRGEDDIDIQPAEDFYSDVIKIGPHFFSKGTGIPTKLSSTMFSLLKSNNFLQIIGKENPQYLLDITRIEDVCGLLSKKYPDFQQVLKEKLKQTEIEVKSQPINGRFFLCGSNNAALRKIIQLWEKVSAGKPLGWGYTSWEKILRNIVTIRFWNEQDRLRETKVLDYFKEELEFNKESGKAIIFELEFWYNHSDVKRKQIEETSKNKIISENGKILNTCIINEINFHAMKISLPYQSIEKVLRFDFPGIFRCDDVKFIRPTGQSVGDVLEGEPFSGTEKPETPLLDDRIIAACLDGYPLSNHILLAGRISVEDPDDYSSSYHQVKEMRHGTEMLSLICHGDLEAKESSIRSKIYVRPIMQPDKEDFIHEPRIECIPKEIFFEDLVERAVRRIFEGEGGLPADAPDVKIINISICDCNKPFLGQMSSIARLLDWLSFKYNVLFILSAGNINDSYELNVDEYNEQEFTDKLFSSIIKDRRHRKLFSPSESINSITVSSLHADALKNFYLPAHLYNIQPNPFLPAPYSSHGFGLRDAIKPDLIMPGGRQLYMRSSKNKFEPSKSVSQPGQKVAAPGPEGEINRHIYTRGTSNSCALCTKRAIEIYEMLYELSSDYGYPIPYENLSVLIKTLLVHSSSWGDSEHQLTQILAKNNIESRTKRETARFLGYGIPQINRVLECTQNRVTAIGASSIKKEQRHEYRFPLPPSFSGRIDERKLTITLAWFSPIHCFSKKYRAANLSFDPKPPADKIGVSKREADWQQVRNGTIQHEILKGQEARQYIDGEYLSIPVICKEDATAFNSEVKYGLAVTFEIPEEIELYIYDEIKDRITIGIEIKTM